MSLSKFTVLAAALLAFGQGTNAWAQADAAKGAAPAKAAAPAKDAGKAADTRPTVERLRESNVIRVGHRADALPIAYLDGSKQPVGYGVEMCAEVINQMKRELKLPNLRTEYVQITAADRFPLLRNGRIDIECGQTVNNAERRKDAFYAIPYFFTGPQILVKTGSPIADFNDLNNRRISAPKGTNSIPILRQRLKEGILKGTEIVETPNNETAFQLLEKGEVEAMVQINVTLAAYRASAKDPKAYKVVGAPLVVEPVAIIVRHGDVEFKRLVDKHLAALMLDGVAERIYRKWFLNPIPPNGVVIDIPVSGMLRDQFRWPNDRTGDEIAK
jgi:glutamate/aspartate transport system substrate-binding protein